ncbi:bifunctional demethylmenaquinone methyltransferase/2-methoxy-6-polyprenyl-1,4-benzoquinol methylase UbiE [Limosilactobacillus panis]|uniref:bifunctional demethylmenaquinone methyltransferase/2-methoxy-6-polyprenyl-1,4-benzoquinol methylase UbiE n=1 Tax=Limosilactobacillus panis TaxID=47493 RepID=UPI001C9755A2|nr:bifunctional demethylmenaquinone methyltransferase/2-methoxy-6-polyprenyl-1,4-benzoquinol methylase UbiE [Limosilactobacillus panis]QZN92274.1 bifunctional demethylmenaquinone methyltransferase/2-methoxy-6-polyprenyl-1,4-benzoquinol methylase UbiE [Limosilactobacillus panis]
MTRTNNHSEKEVNQLFSRIAGRYDLMNNVISLGTQELWRKKLFQQLKVAPGADCLDLCCGTGDLTIELARRSGPSGRVIGLDFNAAMLTIADKKIRQLDLSKDIELVQADAMHLPFSDNSFSVVTIGFGLRNVPDADQVLRESYRVLKKGGQFACLEMSQPTNPLVKAGWRAYFRFFPWLAQLARASRKDYRYLKQTAQEFVSAKQLLAMMKVAGFKNCTYSPLNMGAAALHIGYK